jgi:hypothetical protein
LQVQETLGPGREADRVLVQAQPCAAIVRIKAAVQAGFREGIDVGTELRVEKEREARVGEVVALRVDQARGGLVAITPPWVTTS